MELAVFVESAKFIWFEGWLATVPLHFRFDCRHSHSLDPTRLWIPLFTTVFTNSGKYCFVMTFISGTGFCVDLPLDVMIFLVMIDFSLDIGGACAYMHCIRAAGSR